MTEESDDKREGSGGQMKERMRKERRQGGNKPLLKRSL